MRSPERTARQKSHGLTIVTSLSPDCILGARKLCMTPKRFSSISLFSGAMGLDLGFEQTKRFNLLACVEKEPVFCETIRQNVSRGNLPSTLRVFNDDINDVDPLAVLESVGLKPGQLDLLVGGPPCQAFSTAGKRQTVSDPRGTLIWQFLRFVEVMRPKVFVMENVRGLLSAALMHRPIKDRPGRGGAKLRPEEEPGSVIRMFAEELSKFAGARYVVDCFEVNAVNYGAPQLRERVLLIGNRFEGTINFPNPTHGLQVAQSPKLTPWATLRDAIGDLRESSPTLMDFSPRKKTFLSLVPPGGNWRSLPVALQEKSMGKAWHAKGGRSGWWRRLSYDLPCPTLVTMPNHASTSLCHPNEIRALSVREYARIQEFPDAWEICGNPSQQYAQIGNAVPTRLGRVAGNVVANFLDDIDLRRGQKYAGRQDFFRLEYVQSHVRTRKWFHEGKSVAYSEGNISDVADATYSAPRTVRRVMSLQSTASQSDMFETA